MQVEAGEGRVWYSGWTPVAGLCPRGPWLLRGVRVPGLFSPGRTRRGRRLWAVCWGCGSPARGPTRTHTTVGLRRPREGVCLGPGWEQGRSPWPPSMWGSPWGRPSGASLPRCPCPPAPPGPSCLCVGAGTGLGAPSRSPGWACRLSRPSGSPCLQAALPDTILACSPGFLRGRGRQGSRSTLARGQPCHLRQAPSLHFLLSSRDRPVRPPGGLAETRSDPTGWARCGRCAGLGGGVLRAQPWGLRVGACGGQGESLQPERDGRTAVFGAGRGVGWSQCDRTGGAGLPLSRGHLDCPAGSRQAGLPEALAQLGVGTAQSPNSGAVSVCWGSVSVVGHLHSRIWGGSTVRGLLWTWCCGGRGSLLFPGQKEHRGALGGHFTRRVTWTRQAACRNSVQPVWCCLLGDRQSSHVRALTPGRTEPGTWPAPTQPPIRGAGPPSWPLEVLAGVTMLRALAR